MRKNNISLSLLNMRKQLTNCRNVRVRKYILYESEDQTGFSNTAVPKNKNFVRCLVLFLSHNEVKYYKQVHMKSALQVSITGRRVGRTVGRSSEKNSSQAVAFLYQAWLLLVWIMRKRSQGLFATPAQFNSRKVGKTEQQFSL